MKSRPDINCSNQLYKKIQNSIKGRLNTFRKGNRARLKFLYQSFADLGPPEFHIFIFGCQRSGTTLLERIFRHDYRSAVFGEFSELSIDKDRTVWRPLKEIQNQFKKCRAYYVVARNLYESCRANEILNAFPRAISVWVYRDYIGVVDSMKRKWGNSFFEISKRVETDRNGVWSLQPIVDSIKKEALNLDQEKTAIDDLYALFWLERNKICFDQNLLNTGRVLCLSYASLVKAPEKHIHAILKKAGIDRIWNDFKTDAHTASLKRDFQVNISKLIRDKCDAMLAQLNENHMRV